MNPTANSIVDFRGQNVETTRVFSNFKQITKLTFPPSNECL